MRMFAVRFKTGNFLFQNTRFELDIMKVVDRTVLPGFKQGQKFYRLHIFMAR